MTCTNDKLLKFYQNLNLGFVYTKKRNGKVIQYTQDDITMKDKLGGIMEGTASETLLGMFCDYLRLYFNIECHETKKNEKTSPTKAYSLPQEWELLREAVESKDYDPDNITMAQLKKTLCSFYSPVDDVTNEHKNNIDEDTEALKVAITYHKTKTE